MRKQVETPNPLSFYIMCVGSLHLPTMHRAMLEIGFEPYIILKRPRQDVDVIDLLRKVDEELSVEEHFALSTREWYAVAVKNFAHYQRTYEFKLTEQPVPAMLIGDMHGKEYDIPLPNIDILRRANIKTVSFFSEQLLIHDEFSPDYGNPDLLQYEANPAYRTILLKLERYRSAGLQTHHSKLIGPDWSPY